MMIITLESAKDSSQLRNINVLQVLLLDDEAVIVLERHLLEQLGEASAGGVPALAGIVLQSADLANIA